MLKCRFFILTVLFCFTAFVANCQTVLGVWKTIDDENGEGLSYVKIYKKGDLFFGDVLKILNPADQNSICVNCSGKNKNKRIQGMTIIEGLKPDNEDYSGGTILDPDNGKSYDCTIWVDESGDLQVRGYIGWFFRTQTWLRVQ